MILHLILTEVLSLLQGTVKNPKSVAKERGILVQVHEALTSIIAGIDAK